MSDLLKKRMTRDYQAAAERLLEDAPAYLHDFYESLVEESDSNKSKSEMTRTSYLRDIVFFIRKYLMTVNPDFRDTEFRYFPLSIIKSLSSSDLEEYKKWLLDKYETETPSASVRAKIAAVVCFYSFLSEHDNTDIKDIVPSGLLGTGTKKRKQSVSLTKSQIDTLVDGIKKNNLFNTDNGVISIDPVTFKKRERTIIRNIAIIRLLTGTGIKVSDLAALDIEDVNLDMRTVRVGLNYIQLPDDVLISLRDYLKGPEFPETESELSGISEYADFARSHIMDNDAEFLINFMRVFPEQEENKVLLNDVRILSEHYRRHGRSGFHPSYLEQALFVSTRGTRMTIRMIEVMVKDLITTYLESEDFCPNKIRMNRFPDVVTEISNSK